MRDLAAFFATHRDVVQVRVVSTRGSSPREAGASLYVSAAAISGTIGGGQLEYMAIDEARLMLRKGQTRNEIAVPLGPEIGQCCGGFVTLSLAVMTDQSIREAMREAEATIMSYPTVVVFGSGHVGRALACVLSELPVRTVIVDDRRDQLALCDAIVEQRLTPLPEQEVRRAPPNSAFVIATNDHAVDFLIATEALNRPDAAYVGLIGSKTKRARFEHWLGKNAPSGMSTEALTCPIGVTASRDKRPEVIALFVAAEVVACLTSARTRHDRHEASSIDEVEYVRNAT